VDDDNTGGPWTGTEANPYQNIPEALAVATPGVTVVVKDTTDPEWTTVPDDITIESGKSVSYFLEAMDQSGIESYWVNDTTYFVILENELQNKTELPLGNYPLEIRAYDAYDNYCTSSILVKVEDTILPDLSSPDDVEYIFGSSGNSITWTFTDRNPGTYEIILDGVLLKEGIWNETADSMTINIDGLEIGSYLLSIIIQDLGGNSVTDEVEVIVLSNTGTTTTSKITTTTSETSDTTSSTTSGEPTSQDSPMQTILIIGAIGGIALVVTAVLFSKGILKQN
jgi:hypothetical protein